MATRRASSVRSLIFLLFTLTLGAPAYCRRAGDKPKRTALTLAYFQSHPKVAAFEAAKGNPIARSVDLKSATEAAGRMKQMHAKEHERAAHLQQKRRQSHIRQQQQQRQHQAAVNRQVERARNEAERLKTQVEQEVRQEMQTELTQMQMQFQQQQAELVRGSLMKHPAEQILPVGLGAHTTHDAEEDINALDVSDWQLDHAFVWIVVFFILLLIGVPACALYLKLRTASQKHVRLQSKEAHLSPGATKTAQLSSLLDQLIDTTSVDKLVRASDVISARLDSSRSPVKSPGKNTKESPDSVTDAIVEAMESQSTLQ